MSKRPNLQLLVFIRRGSNQPADETDSTPYEAPDDAAAREGERAAAIRILRGHRVRDGAFRSADDLWFWSTQGVHLLPRVDWVGRD